MVVLLEDPPISTEELWSSVRVTIGVLVTYLNKAFLPWLLSVVGRPALGRVLVVTLLQICASSQSWLRALLTIPLTSWLGFCSDMRCGTLYRRVCLSKSCPINWVYQSGTWAQFQVLAKALNAYVNKVFLFFICNKFANISKNLFFALSLWGIVCRLRKMF
jgi:hypothetical protein